MTSNEPEASTDVETFDWLAEPDNSVMRWLLPVLLADEPTSVWDELKTRTDGFRNVTVTVRVNGVELPARRFLDSLVRNFDADVDRTAVEKLKQVTWLETLQLHVEALEQALSQRVRDAARELELPLKFFEEDE